MQICDEAHRCAGRSTKRDAQPLSDGFLRASRRLFLTATPRPLGAKRDKEGELLAVASMDDQALFGRVAYRLAYSDAVARRLVAPLKLVFLDLTKLVEEYALAPQPASSLVALGDAGDGGGVASRELAELSAALLDCHRQQGVRTAFAFCANNARAAELERVARSSLAAHGVALGRVSGRMSAPARAILRFMPWEKPPSGSLRASSSSKRPIQRSMRSLTMPSGTPRRPPRKRRNSSADNDG